MTQEFQAYFIEVAEIRPSTWGGWTAPARFNVALPDGNSWTYQEAKIWLSAPGKKPGPTVEEFDFFFRHVMYGNAADAVRVKVKSNGSGYYLVAPHDYVLDTLFSSREAMFAAYAAWTYDPVLRMLPEFKTNTGNTVKSRKIKYSFQDSGSASPTPPPQAQANTAQGGGGTPVPPPPPPPPHHSQGGSEVGGGVVQQQVIVPQKSFRPSLWDVLRWERLLYTECLLIAEDIKERTKTAFDVDDLRSIATGLKMSVEKAHAILKPYNHEGFSAVLKMALESPDRFDKAMAYARKALESKTDAPRKFVWITHEEMDQIYNVIKGKKE